VKASRKSSRIKDTLRFSDRLSLAKSPLVTSCNGFVHLGGFFSVALALVAVLFSGCADSKEVNAAFSQTRVTWYLFDADRPDGLRALAGFEQPEKVVWVPRTRAVRATDLVSTPGATGALAVSHLGLLAVDDADGNLRALRPGAPVPLTAYQTDRLLVWKGKLFLTLSQELPAVLPPATLAWWAPGQPRLTLLPLPSQVTDPSRQAVGFVLPSGGTSLMTITWKRPVPRGVAYDATLFDLDGGAESPAPVPEAPSAGPLPGPGYDAVRARLADRLGAGVPSRAALGPGALLVFTEAGWVAVAKPGAGKARLYHLPELGPAGRYTGALSLSRGYVFTWETGFRGYGGAAGVVHVPFAVLAP
jgi:hypothetical protein